MNGSNKRFGDGKLSNEQKQFIVDNYGVLTNEEIAVKINKNPKRIDNIIDRVIRESEVRDLTIEYDIKQRPFWKELEAQLTKDELDSFVYHWGKMIEQFKHDVLHTEEIQIVDAIKIQILMDRSLRKQKDQTESISRHQNYIDKELLNPNPDFNKVAEWEKDIAFAVTAQGALGKEFLSLQDNKSRMLSALKGTREQRIKRLEESQETLLGWFRRVYSDKELRTEIGRDIEKMRLAMYEETKRLSEYHTYSDGSVDQPFLNSDTIKD